jgi:hypothetical protein
VASGVGLLLVGGLAAIAHTFASAAVTSNATSQAGAYGTNLTLDQLCPPAAASPAAPPPAASSAPASDAPASDAPATEAPASAAPSDPAAAPSDGAVAPAALTSVAPSQRLTNPFFHRPRRSAFPFPRRSASPSVDAAGGGTAAPAPSQSLLVDCTQGHGTPAQAADYVDITQVAPNAVTPPAATGSGSRGSFTSHCGLTHRDSDNVVNAPGKLNGAQHVHNYYGNRVASGIHSSNAELNASGTSCTNGDKGTYQEPVLRLLNTTEGFDVNKLGGALDGNVGRILNPVSLNIRWIGSPVSKVSPLPLDLRLQTGDAKTGEKGLANEHAKWTCQGFTNRVTDQYPLCPGGVGLTRIFDFPSCWDGVNIDSANHRNQVVFPDAATGACPAGTVTIPHLVMTLVYNVPPGPSFALDGFSTEHHQPQNDHSVLIAIMPGTLAQTAANCINFGRNC